MKTNRVIKDGEVVCRYFDVEKYTVDGTKITITMGDEIGKGEIKSLTDNEATISVEGESMTFKRISEDEYKAKTKDVLPNEQAAEEYINS